MKQVQEQLYGILQADYPLSHDQRRALKGVIEMCDIWSKVSKHFGRAVEQLRQQFNRHTNDTGPGGPTAPPVLNEGSSLVAVASAPKVPPCTACRAIYCPDGRCCGYCNHYAA
jgi:hypothetical protein